MDAGSPDAGSDAGTLTTLTVYGDSLSGWFTSNWNCGSGASTVSVAYTQGTVVASGAAAVEVSDTCAWDAWEIVRGTDWNNSPDYQPGDWTHLSFDLYLAGGTAQLAELDLTLNNNSAAIAVASYLASPAANIWMHVRVPFADLNAAGAPFHQLAFFHNGTGSLHYYVDNLTLENDHTPPPPPADGGSLSFSVNASTAGTQISPYVYGVNDSIDTLGDPVPTRMPYAPLVRLGGRSLDR